MFDLIDLSNSLLQQIPLFHISVDDIKIEIETSPIPLLPVIHIDVQLDIRLGF